jgi:hypothetical protein
MEKQIEMTLPENNQEFESHVCKDWKPSKRNINPPTRIVPMHPGIDRRFLRGECGRCGEILVRRAK